MKLKSNFILRNIADEYMVIPVGEEAEALFGVIILNSTGAFLWELLQEERTYEDLVNEFVKQYSIDLDVAKKDINDFIESVKQIDGLES